MTVTVDAFVYGATPQAIFASIVLARAGKSVALVAPETVLGGMITGGLGITDAPLSFRNWYGVVEEFATAMSVRTGFLNSTHLHWTFAASEAKAEIEAMVAAEANITTYLGHTITGVERNFPAVDKGSLTSEIALQGTRIRSVTTTLETFKATQYGDMSYNGGLLAAAGVPVRIGREGRDFAHEPRAGVITDHAISDEQPIIDADGDLMWHGQFAPSEEPGAPDRKSMAVGWRHMITNVAGANNLGVPAPANYDAADFADIIYLANQTTIGVSTRDFGFQPIKRVTYDDALAAVHIDGYEGMTQSDREEAWSDFTSSDAVDTVPGKFATNGSDIAGPLAWEYTFADDARRDEIREQLWYRWLGTYHTLQNDPGVPAVTRNSIAEWGLCAD